MKLKIYLAKSNLCLIEDITRVVEYIEKKGDTVLQYLGGKYTDTDLLSADNVFVLLPNKLFYCGKGIYSQIKVALEHKIPCFLIRFDDNNEIKTVEVEKVELYNTDDYKEKFGIIIMKKGE